VKHRANDFPVLLERLTVDDETLIRMHEALLGDISEREQNYLCSSCASCNRLRMTVARLAYEFAKEEYDHVYNEMLQRGLIAS
jgi:4-hydroxy-3-methylbut-2-en-1-yl diphosphate synthase IspG/GcpE